MEFKEAPTRKRRRARSLPPRRMMRGRRRRFKVGELKFLDNSITDASIASAGTIVEDSVLGIAQGVGPGQRVGRQITVKKLMWRYNVENPSTSGSGGKSPDVVRLILYLDKQCNGAAAVVGDILESADYQSFRNPCNSGRFQILMDRTHQLNAAGGAGDGTSNDFVGIGHSETFFKDVNIKVEFNSTTGAITELTSNNIGVLIISKLSEISVLDSILRVKWVDN